MSFLRSPNTAKSADQAARTGRQRHNAARKPSPTKLQLEALEDRSLPSFLSPVPYAVGTNPQAVVTADLNGDGKLDLVVANQTSNSVSILLGSGDGTFQAAQNFATGAGPHSVAVGDFDADGKLDIVTANSADLSVLSGNGDGSFQAPTSINLGSNPLSVAVGDFNADGKLDLTVTSHVTTIGNCYLVPDFTNYGYRWACDTTDTGLVSVLLGHGDGTFAAPSAYQLAYSFVPWWSSAGGGANVGYFDVKVGDFNGDGRLDLATANHNFNSVSVLLGNGDGTFQTARNFAVGTAPVSVAIGDFNADGRPDIVTANSGSNDVSVLLGNGDGTFQTARNFAAGASPRSVATADFNTDGKADVVTANSGGNDISVLLGTGDGRFGSAIHSSAGAGPVALAIGHFNADSLPDVTVVNQSAGAISILINDDHWPRPKQQKHGSSHPAAFTINPSGGNDQRVMVNYAGSDGTPKGGRRPLRGPNR